MAKTFDGKSFIVGGLAGLLLAVFIGAAEDTDANPAAQAENARIGRYLIDVADTPAGSVWVIDTVTGRVWRDDEQIKLNRPEKTRQR